MDFFVWMRFVQAFADQIFVYLLVGKFGDAVTVEQRVTLNLQSMYLGLYIGAGLFLAGLIFGGIALRKIAKKAGVGNTYLAFIPFVNTWYAGKIAGETNFFGQKMKRAGLYAMILEMLYAAVSVFLLVLEFMLTRPEYYSIEVSNGYPELNFLLSGIPAGNQWMYYCFVYCDIISDIVWIMMIVFLVVVFMAFFRKYFARNPVIMSILCSVLPFRGYALFAVRNNAPVDYNAYMRQRAAEYARRAYGGYGAPPQDGPFSDYNEPPKESNNGSDDGPFSEFN